MTDTPEPQWWSWAEIVSHADRLGIPNFQRGAVWDTGNRVALLESIYEQSPCGSFVLWAPDGDQGDPRRHGVPLLRFADGAEPMWLVDGQQRTRAMLDTFQQLIDLPDRADGWSLVRPQDFDALYALGASLLGEDSEADDGPDEDAEGELHPWVVVLPAMPIFDRGRESYFGRHSESRNVRRGSMFRRLRPRARVGLNADGKVRPVPPLPVGIVPLVALLAPDGVFHHAAHRAEAFMALQQYIDSGDGIDALDALLPWGPQFVTGHAYEAPGAGSDQAEPMRWSHLHARRDEPGIQQMVACLHGLFSAEWSSVFERFRGMLTGNRFAVGWLPPSDVSAAIDAYVRINRAGIRVRAEERALAMLSRARPDLLDDLAVFTRRRDGDGPVEDQRALLAHESDRQMGFAVWMTAVTRYTTLALLGDYARRWLGVSAIDKDTFGYRLDRVGPNETEAGWRTWARRDYETPEAVIRDCTARATPALVLIDSVLCDELGFDHRMARPSARALYPLIDLFYRVPARDTERLASDEGFRAAVARLLHWTLLAPYIDQPDLEQLIVEVHGINEEVARKTSAPLPPWEGEGEVIDGHLRAALKRYQSALLTIWHRKHVTLSSRRGQSPVDIGGLSDPAALTRLGLHAFSSEVNDARSLQHPSVGWLYAIERRGGAREFSWAAQVDGFQRTGGKVGVPDRELPAEAELRRWDSDDLYPEKQHIVPFTIARQIVGKGGTRATASPSNAIGNLTWLSRRQNGLDALSDRWTVMDRAVDVDNLAARGLLAPASTCQELRDALSLYEKVRDMVLADTWRDDKGEALELFAAFRKARTAWMVEQMRAWLEAPLSDEARRWLAMDE
jgi:hypothetical protein